MLGPSSRRASVVSRSNTASAGTVASRRSRAWTPVRAARPPGRNLAAYTQPASRIVTSKRRVTTPVTTTGSSPTPSRWCAVLDAEVAGGVRQRGARGRRCRAAGPSAATSSSPPTVPGRASSPRARGRRAARAGRGAGHRAWSRSPGSGQSSSSSEVHWPMRKITNSAGFRAATPTRTTSRPLSMSFCVIVERSTFTKKASSGLVPTRRPLRHSSVRKSSTCRRTWLQVASSLGSKTTHWSPWSIVRSM